MTTKLRVPLATVRPFQVVGEVAGRDADTGFRTGADADDIDLTGCDPAPDALVRQPEQFGDLVDGQELGAGGFMRREHEAEYLTIAAEAIASPGGIYAGGVCHSVNGVPRTLARFNAVAAAARIERNAAKPGDAVTPVGAAREVPDHAQLRGTPVIVLKTPAWRRQDWAEPQRPPTRARA